jgi:hypothetical protein
LNYPRMEPDTGWVDHHPRCPVMGASQDLELSDADYDRLCDDPDAVWSLVLAVDERNKHGAEGRFLQALRPFSWVFECHCRDIQQDEREDAADRKYHERKEAGR